MNPIGFWLFIIYVSVVDIPLKIIDEIFLLFI